MLLVRLQIVVEHDLHVRADTRAFWGFADMGDQAFAIGEGVVTEGSPLSLPQTLYRD